MNFKIERKKRFNQCLCVYNYSLLCALLGLLQLLAHLKADS